MRHMVVLPSAVRVWDVVSFRCHMRFPPRDWLCLLRLADLKSAVMVYGDCPGSIFAVTAWPVLRGESSTNA